MLYGSVFYCNYRENFEIAVSFLPLDCQPQTAKATSWIWRLELLYSSRLSERMAAQRNVLLLVLNVAANVLDYAVHTVN